MESVVKTNSLGDKCEMMTLRGYYNSLPVATHPKIDFIRSVAKRCGVTSTTARNWAKYGVKPINPDHILILSEMTGIPVENLWVD